MIRLLAHKRGTVVTVFALSAMVMAVMTAVVVNQVTFYMGKRKLQAAVDLTALMMMQSGNLETSHAKALIASQIGSQPNLELTVTRGSYTPDAGVAAADRFEANATPFNAIQVDAKIPTEAAMFGGMLPSNLHLKASARAARRETTTIAVGSRLVRVEGGLSAALLDATLGYDGKLTVMDYNSLASANVDAVQFLNALNVKANINAVTFNDVLDAPVKIGDVVKVLAETTDDGAAATLLADASPASGGDTFKLKEVVHLGSIAGVPLDGLTSGETVPISVGELLAASAALSDGDHQIALNLSKVLGTSGIANAKLDVGEKPQILQYDAYAEKGSSVSTSQFKLSVGALGAIPASALAVTATLASATVKVDAINCHADGTADVTLKATTSAGLVGVKAPVLPPISVKAGSDEELSVNFTPADIAAQTYKPVHSSLALQTSLLGLTTKILLKPVDDLLEELGLHVAEADVKVMEASCGSPGLVY
ncbi:MAG: hypothetical protein GC155_04020 [Alphaproteobacteria bacterium]|nr:hypothetical protein [Alphaproteobacteria bacterium]